MSRSRTLYVRGKYWFCLQLASLQKCFLKDNFMCGNFHFLHLRKRIIIHNRYDPLQHKAYYFELLCISKKQKRIRHTAMPNMTDLI